MNKIVCNFSCGAASAVATKLILTDYPDRDIEIVNVFIKEEHEDNRRFLFDCEKWFGRPITILHADKYDSSAHQVFLRKRFLKSAKGAPCSKALKRDVLDAYIPKTAEIVLGYTSDEQDRFDRFLDSHNNTIVHAPLIERGLSKENCLALIERAGILLPEMYRKGYNNANCIGCVKGGMGYMNKVRRDFPDKFEKLAKLEELLGPTSYLFFDRKTGKRFSLRELPPDAGRHNEILPDCGAVCELAEVNMITLDDLK